MLTSTAQRLSAALLAYMILVILLLTWNPFALAFPDDVAFSTRLGPRDALANVLLFFPVGYLYRLGLGRRDGAILLGLFISGGIEVVQLFIPGRTPSLVDVAMNTLGAWLGALLHDLLTTRIRMTSRMVGQLALEAPLMGLMYLMIPLLWVNRLIPGDAVTRWLLTGLIGIGGAIVLSDIFRQWWGSRRLKTVWRAALAVGIWFLVGIGPSLRPNLLIGSATLAALSLLAAGMTLIPQQTSNRRLERATLSRLLPVFVLYLLLQALWPFSQPIEAWHGSFGFLDPRAQDDIKVNIRLIEHLAAFTVLGYILAEWHGRAELSWRRDFPQLLGLSLLSALALEIPIGFQAGPGASFVRLVIASAGALFGGVLYHLQRDHVRFLLGRPAAAQSVPEADTAG